MASTYSALKIELIGTGDQAGTWGATTNVNLGTAIEEAITGSANVTFASSNVALALTDTNATQTARNLRLNLTGTISNVQHLFVPAIEKQYLVVNSLSNSVIIANGSNSGATGSTFTLPAGSSAIVFNDSTNIVDGTNYASSLKLGSALPIASGGTEASTAPGAMANLMGFTTTATAAGTTTLSNTSSYYQLFTGTSTQTIVLPVTSTLTQGWTFHICNNSTGNLSVQSSGANAVITVLPGTTAMCTCVLTTGTTAASWEAGLTDFSTATGTGDVVLATSPTLVTPALGTPVSGILANCTVDGTNSVGFRNVPVNSQSAAYTTVAADSGKFIFHPSTDANARTFTIDSNANVPYAIGTVLTFINMTSQVVTIAINSDTMYLAGTGTTGSRSLAQYGIATAIKMTSTTWLISGNGVT